MVFCFLRLKKSKTMIQAACAPPSSRSRDVTQYILKDIWESKVSRSSFSGRYVLVYARKKNILFIIPKIIDFSWFRGSSLKSLQIYNLIFRLKYVAFESQDKEVNLDEWDLLIFQWRLQCQKPEKQVRTNTGHQMFECMHIL